MASKRANNETDAKNLELAIDRLVYELYSLTEEEIAIVEGRAEVPPISARAIEEESAEALDMPAVPPVPMSEQVEVPAKTGPSDYGTYKCSECGRLVMGFAKDGHTHPGRAVVWSKIGK